MEVDILRIGRQFGACRFLRLHTGDTVVIVERQKGV
jgi:hypothetical protein